MNKRIRQIAELSGFFPVPDETEWDWEYRAENFRYEKFAELIVKETIDEMITQMWYYGIDESNNPQFYKMIDRTIQEMLYVAPAKD